MIFNDHGTYIYIDALCDESQVACRMTLGTHYEFGGVQGGVRDIHTQTLNV